MSRNDPFPSRGITSRAHDKYLILTHRRPDGDTLGSASALARALIAEGKRVRVECGDKIPKDFAFIV